VLSPAWPETQKVALLFARGPCHFEYSLGRLPGTGNLPQFVVAGPSVSKADGAALRDTLESFSIDTNPQQPADSQSFRDVIGPDWFVEGRASKGAEQKRFRWLFWELTPPREGRCPPGQLPSLDIGKEQITLELSARVESLFQSASDTADETLYFETFAQLDTDEDGWISQTELERDDGPPGETSSPYERTVARLREKLTHISSPMDCLPAADL
jgi:hypothetical protein